MLLYHHIDTDGRIAVLTSQADSMEDVRLDLVDEFHRIQHSIPLTKCSDALVSDLIYYPLGSFSYHLAGKDSNGIDFDYDTKSSVSFHSLYFLTIIESSTSEISYNDMIVLSFNLTNLNEFDSRFSFFVCAPTGIEAQLQSTTSVIKAGESIIVNMDVYVPSYRVESGSHNLTLTVTNGGDRLTATRTITLKEV